MMPGTDFKACLETPHLWQDAAARQTAATSLSQAQELLARAQERSNAQGDPAEITQLAYRTMYSAAKALLHQTGYAFSNFQCMIAGLQELYVKSGKLQKDLVDQLIASQKYEGVPQAHCQAAESFVSKTKELLP